MKKIQFMSLMALMLLVSNTTMAQIDSKSEISFSVGAGTPNERGIGEALGEGFAKAIASAITGGLYDPNTTKRDDSSSLAFKMPVAKFMWIEKNHIGLYSKAAAGICIASNSAKACSGFGAAEKYVDEIKSDKGTRFAYQVSAIGFEAGSKNIRGFVELGYGFQGFAQAGVSVKF